MSHSILKLAIKICFFIAVGSVQLKYISAEEIHDFSSISFGSDFFVKFSYLSGDGTVDISPICSTQLQILENGIKLKELWALKFADAWAKVPAGMLYGNNMDMGNFDECLSISESFKGSTKTLGKYCLSSIELTKKQHENDFDAANQVNLELGICIPKECKAFEVQSLLNKYIERYWNATSYNSSVQLLDDECTSKDRGPFEVLDWIAIGVLIVLGALMVLSTAYEYLSNKPNSSINHLWSAFSIKRNMSQLMRLIPNSEAPHHVIPALNGIRCLSIIYIIFLHTYMMLILSPNLNNAEQAEWKRTPFHMIWKNGSYAVDSFFFLSGLLLISSAFREMERNSGKLNVSMMYLHRLIRLSPVLYLAVLLFMTLFRFSANGPIWNNFTSSYKLCDDTWWATLLYVQNYAAAGEMCFGHSWYLAVDTQLYFISPLVLILIWRWRRWGLATLLFIGLLLIGCLLSMIIINDYIVFEVDTDPGSDTAEMRQIYYATHTRASPWIIGIIFGYYLHAHKGRRVVLSKCFIIIGWILSLGLFFTVIFALYPKTQPDAKVLTSLEGAFYLALSHVAWPLGLCWVVFACVNGYGGPINEFLSWIMWQPLTKISYCMYIFHFPIVQINAGQIKTNSHFSNYDAFLRFWSDFGITLIVSTVMYLAIEAPMLEMEKYIFPKKTKAVKEKRAVTTISQQNLCD